MRILGFVLLVLGFVWLSLMAGGMNRIASNAVIHHYNRLPSSEDARISVMDAERELRETAFETVDHIPFIFGASCTMLTGGLLLAFGKRRVNAHAP
jgi:hypothetical protein